jgi:hypothetical protein
LVGVYNDWPMCALNGHPAQRLAQRGTLEDEGPHQDQKHNCRRAEQD